LFQKNENKIIIRDPKHSEYKFFNGVFKFTIGITKFFALCFSMILFALLIGLVFCFVISFLIPKTELLFIGLLVLFTSLTVINIDCILLVLNFVFNRKNDKKKLIWSFIISLVFIGIGLGLISIGLLKFDYIENDKKQMKTDYIEFEMTNDLFFEMDYTPYKVDYIESNTDNVKIEYQINKLCNINYSNINEKSGIHFWGECSNPIDLIHEIINNLNNQKIITITNEVKSIKIYTSKENIEKLKSNRDFYLQEIENNKINYYENRIEELEKQNEKYFNQIKEYEQEIANLENQLFQYQLVE